ncbi:asparaginase [Patescibacteria group bacterium]|nr:asparaginase [Patescibacteria group bacterium]MBU1890748.1 asparaginase [Patescibacteria group bacterium]
MNIKRKKICLLFCGGSILVSRDSKSIKVLAKKDIPRWMNEVSELKIIAEIDPVFVFSGSSDSISPEVWSRLAKEIKKRYNSYDGFVITHDFDSIVYSSAALSFMLQNLGKPVILTGSHEVNENIKGAEKMFQNFRNLGIRANLINAVQVAIMNLAEVGIMYGNRLLQATQTQKSLSNAINLYDTTGEYLGKVDFGIRLAEDRQLRRKTALVLRPMIERSVFVLHLYPGMDIVAALNLLSRDIKAIIIRAADVALKTADIKHLEKFSAERKVPIFIQLDDKQQLDQAKGLIYLPTMIPEVSLVKVMWALGQTKSISQLRSLIKENLANEFLNGQ